MQSRSIHLASTLGNTQLKVHLARLVELEYLLMHRGKQGQGCVYELAYDGRGQDGGAFLPGLAALDAATTTISRGAEADFRADRTGRGLDEAQTPVGGATRTRISRALPRSFPPIVNLA